MPGKEDQRALARDPHTGYSGAEPRHAPPQLGAEHVDVLLGSELDVVDRHVHEIQGQKHSPHPLETATGSNQHVTLSHVPQPYAWARGRSQGLRKVSADVSTLAAEPRREHEPAVLRAGGRARRRARLANFVGYGEHPPRVEWPGGARVAVQIVVNYEEGSEKSFPMGDGVNDGMHEIPFHLDGRPRPLRRVGLRVRLARRYLAAVPDLRRGRRAGDVLRRGGRARAQPGGGARSSPRGGDEAAGHGFRWSNHFEMTRDEEREAIRLGDRVDRDARPASARSAGTAAR